jgi:hypothetical protein
MNACMSVFSTVDTGARVALISAREAWREPGIPALTLGFGSQG